MGVFILVRHGQASLGERNYDRLSVLGKRQAVRTAMRFADGPTPVRRVVSGSLSRQQSTAEEIARVEGLAVDVDARWDEYDHVGILGDRVGALVFDADSSSGDASERAQLSMRLFAAGSKSVIV